MNDKTLVYLDANKVYPKGGPAAIGYFYLKEKYRREETWFSLLNEPRREDIPVKKSVSTSSFFNKIKGNVINLYSMWMLLYGRSKHAVVDLSKYGMVFFHSTRNMYEIRKDLSNYKGVVLLQSHSPIPYGKELIDRIPPKLRFLFPNLERRLEKMDLYAFERANYIVFPCKEAEEPYQNNWPNYKTICDKQKDHFRYILTGIPAAIAKRSKEDVLSELNMPNDSFIISYVGRHNSVKGFDNLKSIAGKVIDNVQNAWVISAGKEEPIKGLQHPRWIEIGWTNDAHSYIAASDVFVLPNKETYFDIVMLEVLSLGKIVVASKTGGNKHFIGKKGIFLYDSEEEAYNILLYIHSLSDSERRKIGEQNRMLYEEMYTIGKMYDRFKILANDILKGNK